MADKTTKELERIYTIPLRDVKSSPRNHRTDRAVRAVKSYLRRHMKAEDVWIDMTVNEKLWERGMYKLASKIRVRALKFDDGVVEVTLPEADVTTSRREAIKKQREEKQKAEEKEEKKEEKEEKKGEEKPAEGEKKPEEGKPEEKAAEEKPERKKAAPEKAEPAKEAPKKAPGPKAEPKAAEKRPSPAGKEGSKSKKD